MNSDIVYEVLKFLHLVPEENGGALLARKVLISQIHYMFLESRNFEKPLVFDCVDQFLIIDTKIDSVIYWGDGSMEKLNNIGESFTPEKKYSSIDNHTVKIFGRIDAFILPYNAIKIHSVGNLTNLGHTFENLINLDGSIIERDYLDEIIINKLDTSGVTDMSYACYERSNLKKDLFKNWNVSKVTDMSYMFYGCSRLNKNVGKNWDTSSVTNMAAMFCHCISLNQPIGKKWIISKVKILSSIFCGCANLDCPIGKKWDTSNVKYMNYMFDFCKQNAKLYQKKLMEKSNAAIVFDIV
jgi:surface protein